MYLKVPDKLIEGRRPSSFTRTGYMEKGSPQCPLTWVLLHVSIAVASHSLTGCAMHWTPIHCSRNTLYVQSCHTLLHTLHRYWEKKVGPCTDLDITAVFTYSGADIGVCWRVCTPYIGTRKVDRSSDKKFVDLLAITCCDWESRLPMESRLTGFSTTFITIFITVHVQSSAQVAI